MLFPSVRLCVHCLHHWNPPNPTTACIIGIIQMKHWGSSTFWGEGGKGDFFKRFFSKVAQWLYTVAEGKVCSKTHSTNPPECPWRNESLGCVSIPAVRAGEQRCCIFLRGIPGPWWWAGGASSALWKVLPQLCPLHKCQNVTEPGGKLLLIWR